MTKHLVDLDDDLLASARTQLGTATIKDTVNAALRLATHAEPTPEEVTAAIQTLATVPPLTDQARREISGQPADPLTDEDIDAALARLRGLTADERQALWQ